MPDFETVVGLEVHVQLNTATKIFCDCSTQFGSHANTQVCPTCLGLPGALPVLNEKVLESAVKTAIALKCTVPNRQKFDRKNYFYPDCPKAYQISQFDQPAGINGELDFFLDGEKKTVRINRLHMEEDAGKLMHDIRPDGSSGVDFNRCGVPLLEIVSEADIRSPEEAFEYLTQLKRTLLYLGVSDCNMEEGSLRCDANISIRPVGQKEFGTRTEVKNMNSFRGVLKAITYEVSRHKKVIAAGDKIVQETRLWNPDKEKTFSMRSKEQAHDYRYFPEPDLVPLELSDEFIDGLRTQVPEIPFDRMVRFETQYKLPRYDADVLCANRDIADYYEECAKLCDKYKDISNWIMGEVMRLLKDQNMEIFQVKVTPAMLCDLIGLVDKGTINLKVAKEVFEESFKDGKDPKQIVKDKGLEQISDEGAIAGIVKEVLAANPGPVEDVKNGKMQAIGFLVGQVMRQSKGKANPKLVNELIKKELA